MGVAGYALGSVPSFNMRAGGSGPFEYFASVLHHPRAVLLNDPQAVSTEGPIFALGARFKPAREIGWNEQVDRRRRPCGHGALGPGDQSCRGLPGDRQQPAVNPAARGRDCAERVLFFSPVLVVIVPLVRLHLSHLGNAIRDDIEPCFVLCAAHVVQDGGRLHGALLGRQPRQAEFDEGVAQQAREKACVLGGNEDDPMPQRQPVSMLREARGDEADIVGAEALTVLALWHSVLTSRTSP